MAIKKINEASLNKGFNKFNEKVTERITDIFGELQDFIQVAVDDGLEIAPVFTNPMIRNAILGEIVGTDFLAAVAIARRPADDLDNGRALDAEQLVIACLQCGIALLGDVVRAVHGLAT